MIASYTNMRAHFKPGVHAYSPITGEVYSADPRDYFLMEDPEEYLVDSNGDAMLLVIPEERYRSL